MKYRSLVRPSRPFIMEIDTTKPGSSSNTFVMPFYTGGSIAPKYRCIIEWGDGTKSKISNGNDSNLTHVYSTSGIYEIKIRGIYEHIDFGTVSTDRRKITKIKQWGSNKWKSFSTSFQNCINMDVIASDTPSLVRGATLYSIFSGCTSLVNSNGSIGNWNSSNVIHIYNAFSGCTQFNQNLSNWDVSKVTLMNSMFDGATTFNNGGQPLNWTLNTSPSATVNCQSMFKGTAFNQNISSWNTSRVTNMTAMFMNCTSYNQPTTFDTSNVTSLSTMFSGCTSFNKSITFNAANCGSMLQMFYHCTSLNSPITLNNSNLNTSTLGMFYNCSSFASTVTMNTSNVNNMSTMFYGCTNYNQDISSWDVSKVITMSSMFQGASLFNNGGQPLSWTINTNVSANVSFASMFQGATNFNLDISDWDVSKVTDMSSMFYNATAFNNGGQPLDWANTGAVTTMSGMFSGANVFNQDISGWNTGLVNNMAAMFQYTDTFNQDISNWDVSKVTTMTYMFYQASAFNNGGVPLDWVNTGAVTNLEGTFYQASAFNADISNWDVSKVTTMLWMFYQTPFNQNIGGWNTGSVTNMSGMFYDCPNFNQDISNWDMSKVINMSSMFYLATAFNNGGQPLDWANTGAVTNMIQVFRQATVFDQDISSWNTSNVYHMQEMFRSANAFNQDISMWDVSNVINFINFMTNKTNLNYSATNLDGIYASWSNLTVQPNNNISFGTIKYNGNIIESGTVSSVVSGKLVDSTQNFLSTVQVGDVVKRISPLAYTRVVTVDSDTQLTLATNLFTSIGTYQIENSTASKSRVSLILDDGWVITDGGSN